ncbi:hypothetical protein HanRHA438_Chr11g0494431 [Helianthus annuus]|nr:hypothetical protein HanRHA438_Chr11g0494431 [Helianthus annuus]
MIHMIVLHHLCLAEKPTSFVGIGCSWVMDKRLISFMSYSTSWAYLWAQHLFRRLLLSVAINTLQNTDLQLREHRESVKHCVYMFVFVLFLLIKIVNTCVCLYFASVCILTRIPHS